MTPPILPPSHIAPDTLFFFFLSLRGSLSVEAVQVPTSPRHATVSTKAKHTHTDLQKEPTPTPGMYRYGRCPGHVTHSDPGARSFILTLRSCLLNTQYLAKTYSPEPNPRPPAKGKVRVITHIIFPISCIQLSNDLLHARIIALESCILTQQPQVTLPLPRPFFSGARFLPSLLPFSDLTRSSPPGTEPTSKKEIHLLDNSQA